MDLPDVNILIAAFRSDSTHHKVAKGWLEDRLMQGAALRLLAPVEAGFLRIVTHPQIFQPASTVNEAGEFLTVLGEAQNVEVVPFTAGDRQKWLKLCRDLTLAGNDCNDAMIAAVALQRNLRVITFDEGLNAFQGCGS